MYFVLQQKQQSLHEHKMRQL